MATIEEALAGMSEDTIATATDEVLIIDPVTRQTNIPGNELVFGVEHDGNAERKYFQCSRRVGNNIDLASCFLRANFRNANGEIDFNLINDVAVSADGEAVTFSWELSPKVTAYRGQTKFVICATRPGANEVSWHTTQATGIILEGLEPDIDSAVSAASDGIAELVAMVEAQTAAVKAEGDKQIKVVQAAAKTAETASVAEIEAKGVNTRDSIPDDYTAMQSAIDALTRGRAGAIVCEVAGETVCVSDASDLPMQGLRIFGRSTQDGTPTPEAPVEIKSVENPVVTVCGKNLLSCNYATEYQTYNGITYTDAGDGKVAVNGTATANATFAFASFAVNKRTFIPAGTYTVSGNPSEDVYLGFYLYDSQEASDYSQAVSRIKGGNPWTFTIEKDSYYGTYLHVPSGNTVSTVVSPQLEIGSVATEYEAPTIPRTVELTNTLPGIPVTSGGNYTDSEGQQWICDEIDLERGVYVHNCWNELVTFSPENDVNGVRYRAYLTHHTYPVRNGLIWSNKLPFEPNANPGVNGIRVSLYSTNLAIAYFDGKVIDETEVLYPLATPIETPLSETELAAYRALHSNYPNTTVLNDSGAHMVVKYAADTKLYIDNKIKEALQ